MFCLYSSGDIVLHYSYYILKVVKIFFCVCGIQQDSLTDGMKTGYCFFCQWIGDVSNLPNNPGILEIVIQNNEISPTLMSEPKSPSELSSESKPVAEMLEQTIKMEPVDESPQPG